MNESDFVAMRQLMLVEIAASAIYTSAQLGKAALDRRVLDVMARRFRVTSSFRSNFNLTLMRTSPYRSASAKRYRSHSLLP